MNYTPLLKPPYTARWTACNNGRVYTVHTYYQGVDLATVYWHVENSIDRVVAPVDSFYLSNRWGISISSFPSRMQESFLQTFEGQRIAIEWVILLWNHFLAYLGTPYGGCVSCACPVTLSGEDGAFHLVCRACKRVEIFNHEDRPLIPTWFSEDYLLRRVYGLAQRGLTGNPVAALRELVQFTGKDR